MRRFEISSDNDNGPYPVLLNILNPNHLPAEIRCALLPALKSQPAPHTRLFGWPRPRQARYATAVPLLRQLETQLASQPPADQPAH